MWTEIWTFLTSLPPLWTILLNNAYVVIWTFGKPPSPLPCPHGLGIPPKRMRYPLISLRNPKTDYRKRKNLSPQSLIKMYNLVTMP